MLPGCRQRCVGLLPKLLLPNEGDFTAYTKTIPKHPTHTRVHMPRTYTTPKGVTLTFEKPLGRGQFGIANAVKSRRGEVYCMKEVSVRTVDDIAREEVMREVELMRSCAHPNVVTLHDSWFERNRLCILMEYCGNGALDALIARFASSRKRFPYQKVVHYMQELSNALSYCHNELRIMHRDLKPANVFMDEIGTLKLGDFGLSKSLTDHETMCATFCGSPLYMSPELCSGKAYTFSTDVWALGCISYELMTLESPWADPQTIKSYPALVRRICNTDPVYASISNDYPTTLVDLTKWMLRKDAGRRATSKEISDHLDIRAPPSMDASVGMSTNMAAVCIQRSMRKSFGYRASGVILLDRDPPPPSPRKQGYKYAVDDSSSFFKNEPLFHKASANESVTRIQNAFRSSRNRFAAPSMVRVAVPKVAPKLVKPVVVPTFRRVPMAKRPVPPISPRFDPRPAWV